MSNVGGKSYILLMPWQMAKKDTKSRLDHVPNRGAVAQ